MRRPLHLVLVVDDGEEQDPRAGLEQPGHVLRITNAHPGRQRDEAAAIEDAAHARDVLRLEREEVTALYSSSRVARQVLWPRAPRSTEPLASVPM